MYVDEVGTAFAVSKACWDVGSSGNAYELKSDRFRDVFQLEKRR